MRRKSGDAGRVHVTGRRPRRESEDGPARWANARLVRYADDFVAPARRVDGRITGWIEARIENWPGYSFRFDASLYGGPNRYLNLFPSNKALQCERDKLREMTGPRMGRVPPGDLIDPLNGQPRGWSGYFGKGYPGKAFRRIHRFVEERLIRHMNRRSQRRCTPPKDTSREAHRQKLGLYHLRP